MHATDPELFHLRKTEFLRVATSDYRTWLEAPRRQARSKANRQTKQNASAGEGSHEDRPHGSKVAGIAVIPGDMA
jgi:hypothetical protein